MSCTPEELSDLLNPIIYREMATIGALDTAMMRETEYAYVMLYRAAKSGKQASIEQMGSMLRVEGVAPVKSAQPVESFLKLQTLILEAVGTTLTLRAMRAAQAEILLQYEKAFAQLEGMYQKAIEKCMHRAKKHLTVLTAHIAKRGWHFEAEERYHLAAPLSDYFAHDEAKVCMRCLFDRPGDLAPLERTDPHPYQYICSACHQEVFAAFAPNIAEKVGTWEPRVIESRIIEKSTSRPSKLAAEHIVLSKMSGLAPDMPEPPMPYKEAIDVTGAPSVTQPQADSTIPPGSDPAERLYTELLFDYESVRNNW